VGTLVPINHIEIIEGRGRKKPVVAGTSITVHEIAGMIRKAGASVDWLVENFNLTHAQVHAAMAYYYDHREQIDRETEETEAYGRAVGTPFAEILERARARQRQMDNSNAQES
jgi:uncharacterized protein (DUF433 family)